MPVETHLAVCEVLRRLQREFGTANLHIHDESGYFDTGDLEALLRKRKTIDDALNNADLILRLTHWAAGDRVDPPDDEQLARRIN